MTSEDANLLRHVRRVVLVALAIELLVLAVTGFILYFDYRPSASLSWHSYGMANDVVFAHRVQVVHVLAARIALWTAVAGGLVIGLTSVAGARRWSGAALGVGLVVSVAAASFTGYLLPWDQLALWAVTVGTSFDGYDAISKESVRFVLIDGREIAVDVLLRWLYIHMIGIALATSTFTALAWRRHRSASLLADQP